VRGPAALVSCFGFFVMLLCSILVVLIGVYINCEWNGFWNSQASNSPPPRPHHLHLTSTSPPPQCFEGEFPVFGNYQSNANAFWVVWVVQAPTCALVVLMKDVLRALFGVPCVAAAAPPASVRCPPLGQADLPHTPSAMVRAARAARAKLAELRLQLGHSTAWQTVLVQTTPDGKYRFIDFHCARYVLRDGGFEQARIIASSSAASTATSCFASSRDTRR